jgi:acyl carrier protein
MNADQTRATLLTLLLDIAPDADPAALDPEADLRTELDLDSMDFLNLVEGVAEATGVNVPEADYGQVRSLRGLADYVIAHAAAGRVAPAPEGT